jgi:seryl-tRNA synthetase
MSLDTVIGLVALAISLISLSLVIVFYFKSDKLYKEMRDFVTEIRTYTEVTYKDAIDMLKEGWGHLWDKESRAKLEDQAQREKDIVKKEIGDRINDEIEKIRNLANEGVKKDSLQHEIKKLEERLANSLNEMSQKITKIEQEKSKKSEKSLSQLVFEIISEKGEVEFSTIKKALLAEFGVEVSDTQLHIVLVVLMQRANIVKLIQKDGKIVYSAK